MAQSLVLKFKGLFTNFNELSSVPEGALVQADNLDILSESLAQPRRGFDRVAGSYGDAADRTDKVWMYQDKLMSHNGTLGTADTLSYLSSGTWTALSGTYSAPTGRKLRTLEANQNLYLTTSEGVRKLDAYNTTPVLSGAYKALDIQASISTSASTWLANAYRTAYRAVWGYRDANNNLVFGAPSQRESIKNTAGSTKAIDLKITIPLGVTTSWFCQLYRAAAVDNTSTDTEPSDDMGQVYEATPTAGSFYSYTKTFADSDVDTGTETITISSHGFTNGDVVFVSNSGGALPTGLTVSTEYFVISATTNTLKLSATYGGSAVNITAAAGGGTHTIRGAQVIYIQDIVPDALRRTLLYTNSAQEGIAYANERPPLAKDLAVFRDCTFYGNTVSKHRYYLDLLAVSGSSGVVNDDTIIIDGITYTGKASENIASAQFQVVTGGSASQNIRDTALSLVRVINRNTTSTVNAFYLSSPDDEPGKILLEERGIGDAAFAVTSSRSTCWSPALPSSGTAESSTNDTYLNGLFWSKSNQPEHVPLANFVEIGNRNRAIQRIIPLEDSLIVFKEDGIFKVTGYYPTFNVDLLDSSAILIGTETPAVLNNTIMALTTQGICSISGSVSVISLPVEDDIRERVANNQTGIESVGFGLSYEAERRYYLFLPNNDASTYCESAYVYNSFTRVFTKHLLDVSCGYVSSDNNLYFGDASSANILQERKTYSYLDHADYGLSTTISNISSTTLTLGSVDGVEEGDVVWQSNSIFANITAVDTINATVTLESDPGFTVAACTILKFVPVTIKWAPITMGNPAVLKQFHTAEIILKADFQGTAQLGFETELSAGEEQVDITGTASGRWGYNWGYNWGGSPARRPARQWIPRAKQRCSQLIVSFYHAYACSLWKLEGIAITGEIGSEKVGK